MVSLTEEVAALAGVATPCHHCQGTRFTRHGEDRRGRQRWRCSLCRRTSIHFSSDRIRQSGIRIDSARAVNLLLLVGKGLSIRKAAGVVGIKADTACSILRRANYVRKCKACGQALAGQRISFCSDECQFWRYERGVFDGTANVLRHIEANGCTDHVRLAIEIATEISEQNMDQYLGPVYEGLEKSHQAGVVDPKVLRQIGWKAVKSHWGEIMTFRVRSLDAMKEATQFEPSDYRGVQDER